MEASDEAFQAALFPETEDEPSLHTYAVLDGAAIPDLLDQLYGAAPPQFICLYAGDLEPDVTESAPYLVQLQRGTPFTTWLLTEGWGKDWGIFALSAADFRTVRKHFRTFLMVKDARDVPFYFRYYDPRVFRVFLPMADPAQLQLVFGPISAYLIPTEEPGLQSLIRLEKGELSETPVLQP